MHKGTYKTKQKEELLDYLQKIIPANDYSETNQSLFLYVKHLDK